MTSTQGKDPTCLVSMHMHYCLALAASAAQPAPEPSRKRKGRHQAAASDQEAAMSDKPPAASAGPLETP